MDESTVAVQILSVAFPLVTIRSFCSVEFHATAGAAEVLPEGNRVHPLKDPIVESTVAPYIPLSVPRMTISTFRSVGFQAIVGAESVPDGRGVHPLNDPIIESTVAPYVELSFPLMAISTFRSVGFQAIAGAESVPDGRGVHPLNDPIIESTVAPYNRLSPPDDDLKLLVGRVPCDGRRVNRTAGRKNRPTVVECAV